jgi:hypothetical protein
VRAALFALVACASDTDVPGPHDEVECGGWLTSIDRCERACAARSATRIDSCDYGNLPVCDAYVEFDGIGGCCDFDSSSPERVVRWTECE